MSSSKKVIHMTTVHHPFDTRIYHKECRSLAKAGYDVALIAPWNEETKAASSIRPIPVKTCKNRLQRMVLSTWDAYQKAKQEQADYYHIHDPELLPIAWLLKKRNNTVIYDIHEDYITSIMQKTYLKKTMRRLIASLYSGMEQAFSHQLKLCLAEKYYKEKYPSGICILNYPILNNKLINHQPTAKPAENKLLYTGNVSIDRGALIHADIPSIDPDVSVTFIGRCPGNLAEKIKAAGENQDRIAIEGVDQFIEREEIDEQYVSQDWLAGLALFPSTEHYRKKELTKFFEYMSAGIPILCSDFPVWKNFIEKYQCGIAVDPTDKQEIKQAIDFLRTNPSEAKKMGENGKRAVTERLNWEAEAEKLINWYGEIQPDKEKRSIQTEGGAEK